MASQTQKGRSSRVFFRVGANAKDFANGKLHCMTPQGGAFLLKKLPIDFDVADRLKTIWHKNVSKKLAMTSSNCGEEDASHEVIRSALGGRFNAFQAELTEENSEKVKEIDYLLDY